MIEAMSSASLTHLNIDEEGEEGEGGKQDELEAELAALMGSEGNGTAPAKQVKEEPKKKVATKKMTEMSVEDVEQVQLSTEDENDPELLGELAGITGRPPKDTATDALIDLNEPDEEQPVEEIVENATLAELMAAQGEHEAEAAEQAMRENEIPETVALEEPKEAVLLTEPEKAVKLNGKESLKEPSEKEKQIAAAKMLALKYKKAGDIEAAKEVLRMIKQLESGADLQSISNAASNTASRSSPPVTPASFGPRKSVVSIQKDPESLKPTAIQRPSAVPRPAASTAVAKPAAPSASKTEKKELTVKAAMDRLEEQATKCLRIIKLYEKQKKAALSQTFRQRAKTMFESLEHLKALPEDRLVALKEVSIAFDIATSVNADIKPDELRLSISQVHAEGFGDEPCWSFQCSLDYGQQEKNTEVGKLTTKNHHDVIFTDLRRDLKLQKFFEHRKLKIELLKHESSLFGGLLGRKSAGQPVGFGVQMKLDGLLKEPTVCEPVTFTGTASKKRAWSLTVDISLKVNTPIGSKPIQRIRENWLFLATADDEQVAESAGTEDRGTSRSPPSALPGAIPVEDIVSYAVLEEELAKIGNMPAQTKSHPSIVNRQIALEQARDDIALRVQLGQVTAEEYKRRVTEAVMRYRKSAIAAKNSNDMALAKSYLQYSKTMEAELADEGNEDEE